jgi:hypothetical protein
MLPKEGSDSSSNESKCIYVFLFVKKPDKCPVLPMLQSCSDIYVTVSYNMEELDYEWHHILIIPGGTFNSFLPLAYLQAQLRSNLLIWEKLGLSV